MFFRKSIRLICHVPAYENCEPLAKQLSLLKLNDVSYQAVAILMFKYFNINIVTTNNLTSIMHGITRSSAFNFYVFSINTDIRKCLV